MDLGPRALWRHLRADLGRPERPMERDLFCAVGSIVIVAVAQATKPGSGWELLALAPAAVASVVRGLGRRIPAELYAGLVVVPVTVAVGANGHLEIALFLPILSTLYTSAQLGSTVRATAIFVPSAASPVLVAAASVTNIGWVPWTAAHCFTFALGLTLRHNREIIDQLTAAREELAEQAVGEERRRLARELHDLAGHTLAAMMLHITGARHVLDRDPSEARRALGDAETVGRASLDQIRGVVATLRAEERGTDRALLGARDLDYLIDSYRRAGLHVDTAIDDTLASVYGPVGNALYRIAQESLTNVARHARTNSATVTLEPGSGPAAQRAAVLTVTDHGQPPLRRSRDTPQFGLVGMRERARALGGHLVAGPYGDGWQVRAVVPLSAVVVDPELEPPGIPEAVTEVPR